MYDYQEIKPYIFTEKGQVKFLAVRDNVKKLINIAGAVNITKAISVVSGDSWQSMACVDRLVELGEIRELSQDKCAGQYRVFVGVQP